MIKQAIEKSIQGKSEVFGICRNGNTFGKVPGERYYGRPYIKEVVSINNLN